MPVPEVSQPRKLGPFLIGRKLGAGGMATVYAAREETQHVRRLVALKLLAPNIAGDDAEHRAFMREAEIATRLEHPNIVRIFDVGEFDGTMFLAMELVHGTSVSALLKAAKGPVPLPIAVRLVSDVAGALHHAHELADPNHGPLGVVHQDVSPQNVLVSYDGAVKLVDFGVARLGSFEGSRTETLRGKPSYASPEQIAGKHIDRRTDVFALGIIAWELLTGERLFRRDTSAATYLAVIQAPIPYVREKNADVPAVVADQIAKALERERDARFKSAEAFRMAFEDAAKQAGVAAATKDELAAWTKKLVPPAFERAELDQEIVSGGAAKPLPLGGVPGAPALAAAMPSPKILEADVPDLDLPIGDAMANTPTKPVPKPTASAPPVPDIQMPRSPSAPDLAPPSGRGSTPSARQSSPALRPSGSMPQARPQSSPGLTSSARMQQAIDISHHDGTDDFDMEIEREGATMSSLQPSSGQIALTSAAPKRYHAPPPAHRVASAGFELAAERKGARPTHHDDYEPSATAKVVAIVVPLLAFAGTAGALVRFAHRAGGLSMTAPLPHAFDGTSAAHSGGVALTSLALALVVGGVGLKVHPRSWALVGSGGAMLVTALAMVTVTLASTGENPMPPDGVLLLPYLVPLSLAALALGIGGRGRQLMLDEAIGKRIAGVPVAALAGAIAFLAFEVSRLSSLLR